MAGAEPTLPAPESPLPTLLALRNSVDVIDQTKASLIVTKKSIAQEEKSLNQEEDDFRDARLLSDALEKRVEELRLEHEDHTRKSPEALMREIVQEQHLRKVHFAKELRKLVKAFNKFVEQHLAAMLAAEDLGGPVVGDMVEFDEDSLKAGFNQQGKAKKAVAEDAKGNALRKRRIEAIWGPQSGDEDADIGNRAEKDLAHAEFRNLTEDLLNAAAGEGPAAPYVVLQRETAGVRFMVREKVAQFHPEDARKLRLVDFASTMLGCG